MTSRKIVSIGLDGNSMAMYRYEDELHLPDHQRSIVPRNKRPGHCVSCGSKNGVKSYTVSGVPGWNGEQHLCLNCASAALPSDGTLTLND